MFRQIERRKGGRKYIKNSVKARLYWYCDYKEFWKMFTRFNKNIKIVDVGCGRGLVSDELYHQGFKNIELIDIEDDREEIFEEVKKMNFYFVDFNYDKFPFKDNSVDLVVSTSVIEHLENQYHYLREIKRILKPGGKFIFTMPNSWNIISKLLFLKNGMIESYRGTNNHISPISKDIFEYMMKDFKLIDRFYNQRTNLGFKPFCYLKVRMPQTEFWGNKVGYLFEK